MVNTYRGEVPIKLDNTIYSMVPSFLVLVNIEDELQCSILDLVNKISQNKHISLKEIEVIIRCSTQNLNISNLHKSIYEAGLVKIVPTIIKFIENAIGGDA
jgi:hypothetical protein